jgi:anti-sigma B factor antagonist
MNITQKNTKSGTSLSVEGELTIYSVNQAKQEMLHDYSNFSGQVALDLHKVSELDTAGVQLLLFLEKFLQGLDKKLYLVKSNSHVDEILDVLGIAAHFTLDN